MNGFMVRHFSFYPFVQTLARNQISLILEAGRDTLRSCDVIWWNRADPDNQHILSMACVRSNDLSEQWRGELTMASEVHYLKYAFRLFKQDGETVWYNSYGFHKLFHPEGSFEILQANKTDVFCIPEWSRGCIHYQIFPDRFSRSGTQTNAQIIDLAQWTDAPTRDNYFGGTLQGIRERLSYLANLGIESLYLNPIFHGDFNHKYATTDYFRVDPMFGTENDLIDLVQEAHELGIRVILDGVFNHTGVHFPPFMDLMENGEKSQYRDWFYPKKFPIILSADCYECVGDYPYMPRLNGENPDVRRYVRDVLLHWLEHAKIDGWRFDVADELDRHAVTWWREEIKRVYPDALMLCETWGDASRMIGPDGFDIAMNYLFRDAVVDFFAKESITGQEFYNRLVSMLMRYPEEVNQAMYNLLGSHDTARFLTEAGGEIWRLKSAMAFQMLFPGAPAIYYGDELGMTGENDPGCRGGMNWNTGIEELLSWQRQLITLRKKHPCVRKGSYQPLYASEKVFAFQRKLVGDRIIAVFNLGDQPVKLDFTESGEPVHTPPRSVKIIEQNKEEPKCEP